MKTCKSITLSIFLLLTGIHSVSAQFEEIVRNKLYGVISSNQDSIALEARLTLQSLPDGDEIYIVNSLAEDGSYQVNLEKGITYKLTVAAEGFFRYYGQVMLDEDQEMNLVLTPNSIGTSLRLNINFELSSAKITEESHTELERILEMMNDHPGMVIQLEGHTDFRGNARKNQELSEERVEAVKNWLVDKGVSRNRIRLKAFGGSQPLSRANTEEGRTMNRRVEVRIIEI